MTQYLDAAEKMPRLRNPEEENYERCSQRQRLQRKVLERSRQQFSKLVIPSLQWAFGHVQFEDLLPPEYLRSLLSVSPEEVHEALGQDGFTSETTAACLSTSCLSPAFVPMPSTCILDPSLSFWIEIIVSDSVHVAHIPAKQTEISQHPDDPSSFVVSNKTLLPLRMACNCRTKGDQLHSRKEPFFRIRLICQDDSGKMFAPYTSVVISDWQFVLDLSELPLPSLWVVPISTCVAHDPNAQNVAGHNEYIGARFLGGDPEFKCDCHPQRASMLLWDPLMYQIKSLESGLPLDEDLKLWPTIVVISMTFHRSIFDLHNWRSSAERSSASPSPTPELGLSDYVSYQLSSVRDIQKTPWTELQPFVELLENTSTDFQEEDQDTVVKVMGGLPLMNILTNVYHEIFPTLLSCLKKGVTPAQEKRKDLLNKVSELEAALKRALTSLSEVDNDTRIRRWDSLVDPFGDSFSGCADKASTFKGADPLVLCTFKEDTKVEDDKLWPSIPDFPQQHIDLHNWRSSAERSSAVPSPSSTANPELSLSNYVSYQLASVRDIQKTSWTELQPFVELLESTSTDFQEEEQDTVVKVVQGIPLMNVLANVYHEISPALLPYLKKGVTPAQEKRKELLNKVSELEAALRRAMASLCEVDHDRRIRRWDSLVDPFGDGLSGCADTASTFKGTEP
eukprot:CAMPEP_0184675562 /NCGR_PEP_ID=MMETSP0308-20130426/87854_1 /TAXON_ID=38269 /ORGANISM="Gloeochaete witrockiana, Strain SAG 46.84" /LENGTH=677 /DNA_ID=CAMNT_0027123275 /DNA_START=438 /DNA_END=2473 /DNA_ORIENTATION=-